MSPPHVHIAPEGGKQSVGSREIVTRLNISHVPMVSLARFIVVAKYTDAVLDECQPIFEPMRRAANGARQTPDNDLDESIFGEHMSLIDHELGVHVGEYTNTNDVLSITPTPCAKSGD
jgi:hypothetical protein